MYYILADLADKTPRQKFELLALEWLVLDEHVTKHSTRVTNGCNDVLFTGFPGSWSLDVDSKMNALKFQMRLHQFGVKSTLEPIRDAKKYFWRVCCDEPDVPVAGRNKTFIDAVMRVKKKHLNMKIKETVHVTCESIDALASLINELNRSRVSYSVEGFTVVCN